MKKLLAVVALTSLTLSGRAEAGEAPPAPSQEALAEAVRALGDNDFQVRDGATEKLFTWGIDHPEAVLKALPPESPDPEVKFRCEELRRRMPWEGRRRRILGMAGNGEDPLFREAVERLFDDPGAPTFDELLKKGTLRQPAVLAGLSVFLDHEDAAVREAAVKALKEAGESRLSAPLLKCLVDVHWRLRAQTSDFFKGLQAFHQLAPQLAGFLDDPDREVQEAAMVAFALGSGAAPWNGELFLLTMDGLKTGLEDTEVPFTFNSKWVALSMSAPLAGPEGSETRALAVKILKRLEVRHGYEGNFLAKLAEDPDPAVSACAARMLESLKPPPPKTQP